MYGTALGYSIGRAFASKREVAGSQDHTKDKMVLVASLVAQYSSMRAEPGVLQGMIQVFAMGVANQGPGSASVNLISIKQ